MTLDMGWIDQRQHTILSTTGESVTLDEMLAIYESTRSMIQSASGRVDVIQDHRQLKRLPPGLLQNFAQMAAAGPFDLPNLGGMVVIVPPRFAKFWQAFSTVFYPIGVVSDMGEALAYLERAGDNKEALLF